MDQPYYTFWNAALTFFGVAALVAAGLLTFIADQLYRINRSLERQSLQRERHYQTTKTPSGPIK